MEVKQILGLDVGQKHIGIARASTVSRLAEPLTTLKTSEGFGALNQTINKEAAAMVVVGLPRNLSGDDTAQTAWVRDWVDKAKRHIKLPLYWQDEALTSKLAESYGSLRAGPKLGFKAAADKHSLAAAIILQDFLDAPEAEHILC